MPTRRQLYTLLQVAKRDLGWSEKSYRTHLAEHGAKEHQGRPSAATMSFAQLEDALAAMRDAGWKKQAPNSILGRCHREYRPMWSKIIALWCGLADATQVRDRSERAMLGWCRRHIDEARPEWAGAASLNRCIEGLKDWSQRAGSEPKE